jgi:arginine exporter protein ArgO
VALNWFVTASGFGIALGLIAAIGAQNAHVLRQGLRVDKSRSQSPFAFFVTLP